MFEVLDALQQDAINQGKCMYHTTELGQLATEYLDDRKQEFAELEKAVKIDMKLRQKDLDDMHREVDSKNTEVKYLIRKDVSILLDTCEYIGRMRTYKNKTFSIIYNDVLIVYRVILQ